MGCIRLEQLEAGEQDAQLLLRRCSPCPRAADHILIFGALNKRNLRQREQNAAAAIMEADLLKAGLVISWFANFGILNKADLRSA